MSEVLSNVSPLLVNDLVALLHDHRLAVGKHRVHSFHNGLDDFGLGLRLVSEEAISELFDCCRTLILPLSGRASRVAVCRLLSINRLYFYHATIEVFDCSSIDLMSFIGRDDLQFLGQVLVLQFN